MRKSEKKCLIFFLLILLFLFSGILLSQESEQKLEKDIYIFTIDLSGSMQRNSLHEKVKESLKDFIPANLKIGNRVILMGFGDDVRYYWDKEITTTEDFEQILNQIDRLVFNHRWTHMSKAFDMLAKRMDEINKLYPEKTKIIYFYTDGINEPPPEARESPLEFKKILEKYWSPRKIEEENIYIYYITFGIEPPEEIKSLPEQSAHFKIVSRPTKPQITDITPSPPKKIKFSLAQNKFKISQTEKQISFILNSESSVETDIIHFNIQEGKIEPDSLKITKGSQTNNLTLSLPFLQIGKKEMKISLNSEMGSILEPTTFLITLEVIKEISWWKKLLPIFIILLFVIIMIWYLLTPKFGNECLVEINGNGIEQGRWRIKSGQKSFSNKVIVSKDLRIPGLLKNSFLIKIDSSKRIFIMPLDSEINFQGKNISKKQFQQIRDDEIFIIGDRRFKLEKRR